VGTTCRIYTFTEKEFSLKCEFQTAFDSTRGSEQRLAVFSPNGERLLTGGSDGLRLWSPGDDFRSFKEICKLSIFEKYVKDLHWHSDNTHIVVLSQKDGKLIKLEGEAYQSVFDIKPPTNRHEFRACRFTPSGNHFSHHRI